MYVIIYFLLSHPTRDGWIEIVAVGFVTVKVPCPIPHGMGGLKYNKREDRDKRNQVPSHTGWVD